MFVDAGGAIHMQPAPPQPPQPRKIKEEGKWPLPLDANNNQILVPSVSPL